MRIIIIENFKGQKINRKLKVLAIKVIVISGKILLKHICQRVWYVITQTYNGENSAQFLDKSKTDWLMLILETCGIVVPHEILRISDG